MDLQPLREGRLLENPPTLRRGDVLVVPQIRMNPFFVVGEVITPMNYFYQPERNGVW